MASQTPTVSVNYDAASISGLANGDNISMTGVGLTLTMDSDSRWAQQAAIWGTVNYGSCTWRVDGTQVWWLPYDGGTGNVPALGTYETPTVITSSGGATGVFLGVWTALGVAPTAAGAAMPSTGFIKLRRVTSGAYADNETLDGGAGTIATVNSTTGGQRGWINIISSGTTDHTASGDALLDFEGDWFYLDPASGSAGQTIQYYVADYCPAIWVETAPSSGVYEIWLSAGTTGWSSTYLDTGSRCKLFSCSSAGVLTLNSSSPAFGFVPEAGCKIRVPNVHLGTATTGAPSTNLAPAVSSRQQLRAASQPPPPMAFDKICFGSFYPVLTWVSTVTVSYCSSHIDFSVQGDAVIDNLAVGVFEATGGQGLTIACNSAVITNSKLAAYATSRYINATNQAADYSATGCTFLVVARAGAASASGFTGLGEGTFTGCVFLGTQVSIMRGRFVDCSVAYNIKGTTSTSNAGYFISQAGADYVIVDGLSWVGTDVHTYSGLASIGGARSAYFRNIGTRSVPLAMGSVNKPGTLFVFALSNNIISTLRIDRVYTETPRTAWSSITSSTVVARNVQFSNCGDVNYASSMPFPVPNTICRGYLYNGTIQYTSSINGGCHFADGFTSNTVGVITFLTQPRVADAPSASAWTVTGGAVLVSPLGYKVKMVSVGDELTGEWPFYILGHTGFAAADATLTATNPSNFAVEFAVANYGGSYSSFAAATSANLSAIAVTDPDLGFKLKVRIRCTTANATNDVSLVSFTTTTTLAYQESGLYPMDVATITLVDVVAGSRIWVQDTDTDEVLFNETFAAGGTWTGEVEYIADANILVRIRKASSAPYYRPWSSVGVITATGFTAYVSQESDE